ncbi:antithrombin III [Thermoflexales bacterium]|nr:antithrombin III [Thermoflexales bacterium]
MPTISRKTIGVLIIVALCAGCSSPALSQTIAQSGLARNINPQTPAADVQTLTTDNLAFAWDLYHALRGTDSNLFFSPHSISTALAMTYAGARGETAAEMTRVLHFTLPSEQLFPAFNALDLALQPGQPAEKEQPLELHGANALWGQQGYTFRSEFLDLLAQNYGAGMRLVDFKTAAEAARQAINQWVSEQTQDRIKDPLAPGTIDALTRLVLVNAIYFKGGWLYPFEPKATHEGPFTRLDGSQVTVPLMFWSEAETVEYARGEGYQIVELPYQGGNAVMTILLPDAGQFAAFEEKLTTAQLQTLLSSLNPQMVKVALPRFRNENDFDLTQVLGQLGMTTALSEAADFSGMTGQRDLYIGAVIHKAFVEVNESGTEAAAATAVVMSVTSAPAEQPLEVKVDRPFIYLIRDTQTGAVLFVGRALDPTQ